MEIGIAQFLLDLLQALWSPLRGVIRRVRLLIFRARQRLSTPIHADTAKVIALSTLGGSVVAAIPYSDFGNPRQMIAVIRKRYDADFSHRVYILEQFADAWRIKWQSEELFGRPKLEAFGLHDFDSDGVHECSFLSASFGSGGGMEILYLYVPAQPETYRTLLVYDWSNATTPRGPKIEVEAEDDTDPLYIRGLETICKKLEIIKPLKPLDLDEPENATLRWHEENGELTHGYVKVYFYDGEPVLRGSVAAQLEDADCHWIASFKGPVYGYIKSQDKHFIAYSPAWVYNWGTCLLASHRYLWIGLHLDGILRFDKTTHFLRHFKEIEGTELGDISGLTRVGDYFLIDRVFDQLHVEARVLEEEWPGMEEILRRLGSDELPPVL